MALPDGVSLRQRIGGPGGPVWLVNYDGHTYE